VAFGEFTSDDLMKNSINPDDFLSLDGIGTGNTHTKQADHKNNSSQSDLFSKTVLEK